MDHYAIYGTSTCQWCERAIELLQDKNINFKYHEIDTNPQDLLAYRVHFPNKKTVPQIMWVDWSGESEYVGGYDDLKKLIT